MLYPTRHRTRSALVPIAILLVAPGCGGGGGDATTGAASPPAATTSGPAASPAQTGTIVTAGLTEFNIELSQASLSPGTYTFVAEEKGQQPHALSIKGPGVDSATTPVIQPGGASQRLTVTLQSGTYELWCPVGNHRQQGMELTITPR